MADDLILGEVPASAFLVGLAALTTLHVLIAWGKVLSARFDRLVDGAPAVVLREGEAQADALRAEHLSQGDVEALLRLRGVPRERWSEVQAARLEDDGMPTLEMSPPSRPAVRGDLD
jgi:uncharacterized membrane protein YcaP (DUF421 family)